MSKTKIITILLWVTAINLSAQTYSGGEGTQADPCLISSKTNKAISRRDKIWVENRMTFQQPKSRQGRDMGENGNDILSLTGQGERGLVDFSTNMMSLSGQLAVAI